MVRRWLVAMAIVLVCAQPASTSAGSAPSPRVTDAPSALAFFAPVFKMVHETYVDEVPARDLVHAAIRGMLAKTAPYGFATVADVVTATGIAAAEENPQEQLRVFAAAFEWVQARYGATLPPEAAVQAAIAGLVMNTDPDGGYWTPTEVAARKRAGDEGTGDIGVGVIVSANQPMVVAPLPGAPAARAGIRPGDRIVRINGSPTDGMAPRTAIDALRGPVGSEVTVSLLRDGEASPVEISIVREVVLVRSVQGQHLDKGMYYLRIRHFFGQTAQEVERELFEVRRGHIAGLVLDLRDNPGGDLREVVRTADRFLGKGQLIVYTRGRHRDRDLRFTAEGSGALPKLPIVVLVNRGTHAGAEIIAAALQDWKRGVLLGTRTAGRASVQTRVPLDDGSEVSFTTERWRSPQGQLVQPDGLAPDIVVPLADSREQPGAMVWLSTRGLEDAEGDVQLQRALSVVHAPRK